MRQTGGEIQRCRSTVAVEQRHSVRKQSTEPDSKLIIDNNRQRKMLKRQEIQEFQDTQKFCCSEKYVLFLPSFKQILLLCFPVPLLLLLLLMFLLLLFLCPLNIIFNNTFT